MIHYLSQTEERKTKPISPIFYSNCLTDLKERMIMTPRNICLITGRNELSRLRIVSNHLKARQGPLERLHQALLRKLYNIISGFFLYSRRPVLLIKVPYLLEKERFGFSLTAVSRPSPLRSRRRCHSSLKQQSNMERVNGASDNDAVVSYSRLRYAMPKRYSTTVKAPNSDNF